MSSTSTAQGSLIVQAKGVVKTFGETIALRALDLEVRAGDCVGLLGPNGAGKSTFIGCLYGVVERTGGELKVFGHDPSVNSRAIKRRLGVVPQDNALDEGLTVEENMRIYARFVGLNKASAENRLSALLAHMSLEQKRKEPIKNLSGGMKRRLTFVRALLSNPELLILDEPTTGLDPAVRHLLWDKVHAFRQDGRTVLLTTHYMHEAEVLCDRIVIMDKGAVVGLGGPRELIDRETPGFVGIFPSDAEPRLRPHLALHPSWQSFAQGRNLCVRAPILDDLMHLQYASGVTALQLRPANLEDVYLKLTGKEMEEND